MYLFALMIAFVAGITIVVARILNANLAKEIGLLQGAVVNYITGLTLSAMLLLLSGELIGMNLQSFTVLPLWAYLGGTLGVLVVTISSHLTHKISSFYLTLFMFIGQLAFGVMIDFLLRTDISLGKVIGGVLVLLGLIYNLNLDRKFTQPVK